MRALALLSLLALPTAAVAGSASAIGAPVPVAVKNDFVPMVHAGVDGGYEFLLGSNGAAYAPGPTLRITADVQDLNMYRVQLAYAVSRHTIVGSGPLFTEPPVVGGGVGFVDMHTITAGSKVMVLAKENHTGVRLIDPWVSTGLGLTLSRSVIVWDAIAAPARGQRAHIIVNGGGGLDVRPIEALSIGASLTVGVYPSLQKRDSKLMPQVLFNATPVLNATVHI